MNSDFPERTVGISPQRCGGPGVSCSGNRWTGPVRGSRIRGSSSLWAPRGRATMGASMTVSFHLSPEQEQLKLGARQFAEEHLRPLAAEVRKEPDPLSRALLARPAFEKPAAPGFLNALLPAPFAGAAAGAGEACVLIQA